LCTCWFSVPQKLKTNENFAGFEDGSEKNRYSCGFFTIIDCNDSVRFRLRFFIDIKEEDAIVIEKDQTIHTNLIFKIKNQIELFSK